MKKSLKQLDQEYDYLLLDCPPTIGILTYNALIAATDIYVPIEMDYYALEGMSQLINTIQLVNEVRDEPIDVTRLGFSDFNIPERPCDRWTRLELEGSNFPVADGADLDAIDTRPQRLLEPDAASTLLASGLAT